VLFAGGGTGGHLFPALAIAQEIARRRPNARFLFLGTRAGIERDAVPRAGYGLEMISVIGLHRQMSLSILKFPIALTRSMVETDRIFRRFRPTLVVGTGGYVSGPAVLTARRRHVPAVIQEQNCFPGLTTRLLARLARQIHLAFSQSASYFGQRERVFVTGNPTRRDLGTVPKAEARRRFGLEEHRPTVLVFGGSQGARSINVALMEGLGRLGDGGDLQMIWQTGRLDYEEVERRIASCSLRIRVYPFIEDMAAAMGAADLAITRAGALTLAELTRCSLPAILVPYPFSAEGHQETNARAFEKAGAARVILDEALGEILVETTRSLLNDTQRLAGMAMHSRSLGIPDAAGRIVDAICEESLLPA